MVVFGIDRVIEADVLVIGGGGAAVTAAVAASQQGVKVVLAAKGKAARSGNTVMIGGGFSLDGESAANVCGEHGANLTKTKDDVFRATVINSFYLCDQNVVEQFTQEAPAAVKQLLEWAKNAQQYFRFNAPVSSWSTAGGQLSKTLLQALKETPGIEKHEDTIIVDLIKSDGAVTGAVGVNAYSGEIILFVAKAVVLGTGGYQPYSFRNTSGDVTGDGVAMAYRAGAAIANMEFLLFLPTAVEPKNVRGSVIPMLMNMPLYFPKKIFKTTDCHGNEVAIPSEFHKIPGGNKLTRILYSYFLGKAIYEGYDEYGNCMYYDFSNSTSQDIEEFFAAFKQNSALWHRPGFYYRVDIDELKRYVLQTRRLKVGLASEYSMGGVEIDDRMNTSIPGLFAAGEVTSGLFGAFRGGDGVAEMLTQGGRAGKSAAEYVKGIGRSLPDQNAVRGIVDTIIAPLNNSGEISPYQVRRELEQIADRGFNFFRNEEGLTSALDQIRKLSQTALRMSTVCKSRRYNLEWMAALAVRNLMICTEAGIRAALLRDESRGTHMRVDKPAVDNDRWLLKIVATQESGEMKFATRAPVVTRMLLPQGKVATIPEYILGTL